MQQLTECDSSPAASTSFAGLLAGLVSPAQKTGPAWSDDELEDDVATLSYEYALKTHARYRASDQSLTQTADAGIGANPAVPAANLRHREDPEPEATLYRAGHGERNLKDASITIRMSKAECAQLQRRAAEAGLTVSAYLRSCTFEAESLRAMVKETLDQLSKATTQAKPEAIRRSWIGRISDWLAGLLTPWRGRPRVARA